MRKRRRRGRARAGAALLYHSLRTTMYVVKALPADWIDGVATALGSLFVLVVGRARRVGMQNLDVVFGEGLSRREKRRILRASLREAVRSVLVLFHAAPLTPARFRRWVDVSPEVEDAIREKGRQSSGAVIVSAHVGNWELLLGLAQLFRDVMPVMFLVEASYHPGANRFLADLRGSGGGESASRKGGAGALASHIRRGGAAGLVVDRNVRLVNGGIWAPYCGLPALTTPLPGMLARANDVPVVPMFCLPAEGGRYRIRLGPECAMDVRTGDFDADVLEITTRVNRFVETVIRERPEWCTWTLKRFKSRPTKERGRYPPYSRHVGKS